mgnify:CR=1 FL=1
MKKILLLISLLAFIIAGCAEESKNNTGDTASGGASAEQLAKVDEAFTNEFKKYVTNDDGSAYTGTFSTNSDTNIKSILQNITGRGGMPAAAGIGEISNEEAAAAIAKTITGKTISAPVLLYSALDKTSNEFMASVMEVFMTTDGMTLITELKRISSNQSSIISLVDSIQTKLGQAETSENARANIVYLTSSLISYLKNNAASGIAGIKEEYVLPNNKEMHDEIAHAFMDQGEYTSNYVNWDKPTTEFTVMPILANGGSMPGAIQTMMALMQKLTDIFVKYGYAENTSAGIQDEEALQTLGNDEMIFPAMILAGLDGYIKDSATQKSKNRALEFYRALVNSGGTKLTTFNPVTDAGYANTTIVPVIITELKSHGVNTYDEFNQDNTAFTANVLNIFFNGSSLTEAGHTLITNYNSAAQNLPSAAN